MKHIPLTQGKFAIVDDADFEWLNRHNWYAYKNGNNWYAERRKMGRGKLLHIKMHRVLLGLEHNDGKQIDHRDCDGLNNQRSNLRICSRRENQHNKKPQKGKSSKFKGVCWNRIKGKWEASISGYLGAFDNEIDAARSYDVAAGKAFGEFAYLNFKEEL